MDNKVYVTWEEVDNFVDSLLNEVEEKNLSFTGVYGIPRGGLVLATLISYRLNIPLLLAPTKNCIIVDDIADSGRSLMHYTENDTQFNKYYIATMFYCNRSLVKPDFYQFNKEDKWIVYPWEKGEK